MINRKFINFKTYNGFLAKKNEIPNDAIVFIQDKLCIWAQGKEYICDGPGTTAIVDNTLTFTNGNDKAVFTVTQDGGTLEFKDSEGNKSSATYILRDEFDSKANQADLDILNEWKVSFERQITNIVASQVDRSELADVAFSGQYQDLKGKPDIPVVDSVLSSTSTNPVWNKTITLALEGKANASDLDNYVTDHDLTKALSSKQDILRAGRGISIDGKVISSTLDTEVYVMVDELGNPEDADPNKIYILEKKVGDTYRYQQYRVRNNTWVLIGEMSPDVDLSGYLTKTVADTIYQPIGSYLTSVDLIPYALAEDLSRLNEDLADYALKQYVDDTFQQKGEYAYKDYVDNTFVKRSEVYNPKQDNWGTDSTSGGGGSEPIIINQGSNITVDSSLSLTSANPVQNAVITAELNKKATKSQLLEYATLAQLDAKADKTQLNSYVTNDDLLIALESKQDHLTAGEGISIVNNVISTNLDIDTSVYLFVDELPLTNINDDKIYIVGDEDDGQIVYTQWKHQDGEWIPIGQLQADIDLSNYITRSDAAATFAPKLNYVTSNVLESFRQDLEDYFQKKDNYVTLSYADDTYQPKNNYLTSVDLVPYAKITDLDEYATLQNLGSYATKQELQDLSNFIDNTYLKLSQVPWSIDTAPWDIDEESQNTNNNSSENNSNTGGQTIINYTIDVDQELSISSSNPVENRIITRALINKADVDALSNYALKSELSNKADKSQLSDYTSKVELAMELSSKQDVLYEGSGIQIDDNNRINVVLDTNPFVIVSDLPTTNINPNKIYLKEDIVNGETTYTEYRRQDDTWVEVGVKDVSIDLSEYIKQTDADYRYLIPQGTYLTPSQAAELYQPKGDDYALASVVEATYQKKGDYVSNEDFEAMRINVDTVFQKKGNYANVEDVNAAIRLLQQVIDQKYVLKKDVYKPEAADFSQGSISEITVGGSNNSGQNDNNVSVSNMVTLTVEQYQYLVNANLVRQDTYYFTYEGEPDTEWHFGDQFPIILTDGSTPDNIGTFPINLI